MYTALGYRDREATCSLCLLGKSFSCAVKLKGIWEDRAFKSRVCAQGCSQWALWATDDLGTRKRTLRGLDTTTVHQFWACFGAGATVQLGRRSKSLFRGVLTHLPTAVRGEAVGEWVVAGRHWVLPLVVFSDLPHFSLKEQHCAPCMGQHRQRPACGEQVCCANPEHFHSNEIPFRRKEQRIYLIW